MPAAFLQLCDPTLDNATGNGSLGKPMIDHIRQNKEKHVQHPKVHFVGQTIQSWRLVEANLLQGRGSWLNSGKTSEPGVQDNSKAMMEVQPKDPMHLMIRP